MSNGLYESEADAGKDADVRAFAARNAPAGVEHLKWAKTLFAKEQQARG